MDSDLLQNRYNIGSTVEYHSGNTLSIRRMSNYVKKIFNLKTTTNQVSELARTVSCDNVRFSVSFNEYLQLISIQRRADPDQEALVAMFK